MNRSEQQDARTFNDTGYAYACPTCNTRHGFISYGKREIIVKKCDGCLKKWERRKRFLKLKDFDDEKFGPEIH